MLDYWNSRIERAPLEELQEIQARKLRQLVDNVYRSSQFYRKRFKEAGVRPRTSKHSRMFPGFRSHIRET